MSRRYNVNNQPPKKKRSIVATGLFAIAVFFFLVGCYYFIKAWLKS